MIPSDPVIRSAPALRRQPGERAICFYNVRLSPRDAWFGATAAASFNTLGMWLEVAIVRRVGIPATAPVISSLIGLAILLVLFTRRNAPSVRWASFLYLINTASVATALLWTNPQFAVVEYWDPFQATKLGCLVAAMVAPAFWVGVVSILAHALTAVVQFEFFFPPAVKAGMAASEPWPIVAFGLAGILALAYRFRRVQLEQEVARIQAQNFAIKRLASAFLNIRNLMNTPLQVIDLSVNVLRKAKEPLDLHLDRIERSVQSLREINSVLVQHEKEIEWESRG